MPSITSWMRLEPRSRSAEMKTSLQARLYDPLWLLARQWQFGEFQGEDNGTPVLARWRGEAAHLTRYQPGAIAPNTRINASQYDASRMPLEALVERESVRPEVTPTPGKPEKLRLAADAGMQFLRALGQQPLSPSSYQRYRDVLVRRFPFPPLTAEQRAALDPDSQGFFNLMATRVPDGRRLYAALKPVSGGSIVLPADWQIAAADVAEVEKAAQFWLQWYETLFSEPEAYNLSWMPERMEYAFSVATRLGDGEKILTAQEYFEGRLDWDSFDLNLEVTLGAAGDDAVRQITTTTIPAPVSFRGMPAARFWEFEDAQVDFGSVDAGPADLARMLLVEFALAYGNDWFVIPVEMDIGSLCRTRSLVVTDTFGVRTLIKSSGELPAPYSTWRMFQLSSIRQPGSTQLPPAANLFFLPPALLKSLESRPIEEVLFLRDEMANMAWAVERVIESPAEQPLNRFEADLDRQRRLGQPALARTVTTSKSLEYRLATEPPDYWIPLLPVRVGAGLRLRRGAVLNLEGTPSPVRAEGRILESAQELSLFEEEVPREGARVRRSYQFTRWVDGSAHLWVGRRKSVGRGEGSSGLRFDRLDKDE